MSRERRAARQLRFAPIATRSEHMSILNFVTQDELDDLPDDPSMAFMTLVNHAQRSLAEQVRGLDPEERYQWEQRNEIRQSFMNVMVAAAKRYEIEPFVSMQVPRVGNFQENDHKQFKADVEHYVTQLMLDNSIRGKRDSVVILPKSKDRIRGHIHALRDCLEKANMTAAKREALAKKLDAFEAELEKRRLGVLAVTRIAMEILALPGGVWASAELAPKLITNIMQTVAESKAAEDETRQLSPVAPPKALSPPRAPEPEPRKTGGFGSGGGFADDLDDDVPF